jgi:hypothetical protein
MSYYSRTRVLVENSLYSDYGKADSQSVEVTGTPSVWVSDVLISAVTTPGSTITLDPMITCTQFTFQNLDATNFVTLAVKFAAQGATAISIKVPAGKAVVLTDLRSATGLVQAIVVTADTAACLCRYSAEGT